MGNVFLWPSDTSVNGGYRLDELRSSPIFMVTILHRVLR